MGASKARKLIGDKMPNRSGKRRFYERYAPTQLDGSDVGPQFAVVAGSVATSCNCRVLEPDASEAPPNVAKTPAHRLPYTYPPGVTTPPRDLISGRI
jgi:hypothetical protein